jgi:hypothetical protein
LAFFFVFQVEAVTIAKFNQAASLQCITALDLQSVARGGHNAAVNKDINNIDDTKLARTALTTAGTRPAPNVLVGLMWA